MPFQFSEFRPRFATLTLEERVNVNICKQLKLVPLESLVKYFDDCKNETERKDYYSEIHKILDSYIESKGCRSVSYSFPKRSEQAPQGNRLFGNGIQRLIGIFRGALMQHTTDIDMKNAHPTILRYICELHSIPCAQLEYYINHRDEVLSRFPDRDEAKRLFLKSTNKSEPLGYRADPFLTAYDKEMKRTQKALIALPEFAAIASYIDNAKAYNLNGKIMNRILCAVENAILQEVVEFVQSKGIEIAVLMFDGLMVYGNHYERPELLREIEAHVEKAFPGLGMAFAYKEHDTSIPIELDDTGAPKDIEGIHISIARDIEARPIWTVIQNSSDYNMAQYIRTAFSKRYCYDSTNKRWYELDTYNKYVVLSNEKECIALRNIFRDHLITEIQQVSEIVEAARKRADEGDSIRYFDKVIKDVREALQKRLQSTRQFSGIMDAIADAYADPLIGERLDSRTNLFAFNNCVYDCETNRVRPIQPEDYISFNTGYDYSETIDPEARERVMQVLRNLFAFNGISDDELAIDLRQFLAYKATAIDGDRSKYQIFTISQGRGGNGKSLVDDLDRMAFGQYFTTCDYGIFTEIRAGSKASPETLSLRGKRLISTSEVPAGLKLQTNTLKMFSGGDEIRARAIMGNSMHSFRVGLVNFNINDEVEFSNNDGGIRRRFKKIRFPISFVDPEKYDAANAYHKLKDTTILDSFRKVPALRMEYMRIIIETYGQYLSGGRPLPISEKHEAYAKEYLEETNIVAQYFSETDNYEITRNDEDVVRISEIHEDFNNLFKKQKIDDKQFKSLVIAMGLEVVRYMKRNNSELRNKMVVIGVRPKTAMPEPMNELSDAQPAAPQIKEQVLINPLPEPIQAPKIQSNSLETPPTAPRLLTREERRKNMRW